MKNGLALYNRAFTLTSSISTADDSVDSNKPLRLDVTNDQVKSLDNLLQGLVSQHRALVEIHNLNAEAGKSAQTKGTGSIPHAEHLDEYPANGADLTNLVMYPPRLRPVPVKPIFLDVAWNYIDYPGRKQEVQAPAVEKNHAPSAQEKKEAKKGWFGFGR